MDALNKVTKYYPGAIIKVEESGEHVILGNGELYMDCLLYDLRARYANIEIKISDPLTVFSESCSSESFASIPVNNSVSRSSDQGYSEYIDQRHSGTNGFQNDSGLE